MSTSQLHHRLPCRSLGSCSCGSVTPRSVVVVWVQPPAKLINPGLHGQDKCYANSPPGTRIRHEFCIEIQRDSNPRGSKLRSPKAFGPNQSATRPYTIGTGWLWNTCDGNPSGTNRIRTSGRGVRAEGLWRSESPPTRVRIPPYIHAKFIKIWIFGM